MQQASTFPTLLLELDLHQQVAIEVGLSSSLDSTNPDLFILEPEEKKQSIGIDQIHALSPFLNSRPIKEKKTLIIRPAEKLTLVSQQALLKTLEEPPPHTQIILVTNYPHQLLPTILSRVVRVAQAKKEYSFSHSILSELSGASIGSCIQLAGRIGTNRAKAKEVLEQEIRTLRQIFLRKNINTKRYLTIQTELIEAVRLLTKNCNSKLVLEQSFFRLIHLDSSS